MEVFVPGRPVQTMSREAVRTIDAWAIRDMHVPGVVLMENAGGACAGFVMDRIQAESSPRVAVLCGTGNNGGDGYVIARHLVNHGVDARALLCGDQNKVAGDALVNLTILKRSGLSIVTLDPRHPDAARHLAKQTAGVCLIVDALFGTGLRGPLDSDWSNFIEAVNSLSLSKLAVDIPSGLDCDTGEPLGAAIRAAWTVSFVAVKQGFLCPRAWAYTGVIQVASIGVSPPKA